MTFAFIFYALDTHQGDAKSFFIYIEDSFKLSRGSFPPGTFTGSEKGIYYIGTLICSMILMTVLISVVAGTFARVRLNA